MAALPTAPQVNGAVIGFGPCPWKPLGGGCGVFSTLTPSCTRRGETPPQPHQAPGFAESPGQGVAAMGSSSFWGMGRKPAFSWGRERTWGNHPSSWQSGACTRLGPTAAAPDTTSFSSARGTQGSARDRCPVCARLCPHNSPCHLDPGSPKSPKLFCISLFSSHCKSYCLTAENTGSDPLSRWIESENKLPLAKRGFRLACTCCSPPVGFAGLTGTVPSAEGLCWSCISL